MIIVGDLVQIANKKRNRIEPHCYNAQLFTTDNVKIKKWLMCANPQYHIERKESVLPAPPNRDHYTKPMEF